MSDRSRRIFPAVLAVMALVPGFARSADSGPSLSWRRGVEIAADQNPELQAARHVLRAATHGVRGAAGGHYPQVSANANRTESNVAGVDSVLNQANVTATQNLFAGFRDVSTEAQARANDRSARAGLEIVRAKVSAELKGAYAQLGYAQENLDLAQDIVRRREENQRLVQLRFESGRENKGSARLAEASLRQARLEARQAEHAVGLAQAALSRVLGGEWRPWVATERVPVSSPPASEPQDASTTTPELEQVRAQQDAAHAGIGVARAGLMPNLNLTGSVGRQGDTWAPTESSRSVGLTLSVPLFSGGRDYHATESAVANHEAARAGRENAERLVRVRIRQSYHAYVQAVEKLEVDREFVSAAMLRAEIARSKYNNGLASFEDWDLIENDLIVRQKALLLSARDRITAEAAYEQVLGRGVIP